MGAAGTALARENAACGALFDQAGDRLGQIGALMTAPLAEARAQVDLVNGKIEEAGAMVDDLARQALAPVDALDKRLDAVAAALGAAIRAIGDTVAQVTQLLHDLDREAEQVKPVLNALPGRFDPVRSAIVAAIALLEQVKDSIPAFVNQAVGALRGADGELDQADGLCSHAIQICTLYQLKAPPLMLARTLFVGVKATIPGLHMTVATAMTSVRAAGTQAGTLMDTAIGVVDALNPLLDQAIALVQKAIDALLALLQKMQDGLALAVTAAKAVAPAMQGAVDSALATAHEVLAKVRRAAEDCLAQLDCEALVKRLRQALSDLLDSTFAPLQAQVDAATGRLAAALQDGKAGVGQAAQAAQDGLQSLAETLTGAHGQVSAPVASLRAALDTLRERIESTGNYARQVARDAAADALAYLDQAAQAIAEVDAGVSNGLAPAFAAYTDGFAAAFASAQSQVGQVSLDAVIDRWRAQAEQHAADLQPAVEAAAGQAARATADLNGAAGKAEADVGAQHAALPGGKR
ncbi:MAG: hypothetical protein EOP35_23525, partial [Rubrivivax sp.]